MRTSASTQSTDFSPGRRRQTGRLGDDWDRRYGGTDLRPTRAGRKPAPLRLAYRTRREAARPWHKYMARRRRTGGGNTLQGQQFRPETTSETDPTGPAETTLPWPAPARRPGAARGGPRLACPTRMGACR